MKLTSNFVLLSLANQHIISKKHHLRQFVTSLCLLHQMARIFAVQRRQLPQYSTGDVYFARVQPFSLLIEDLGRPYAHMHLFC
jgi:hypothetical protein